MLNDLSGFLLLIPLLTYLYNSIDAKNEILKKVCLYISFLIIPLIIGFEFSNYNIDYPYANHSFSFSVILIIIGWIFTNNHWKKRIEYFIVPFSFLAVISSLFAFDNNYFIFNIMIFALILFNLYIIDKIKWNIINILPLLQLLIATIITIEEYHLTPIMYSLLFTFIILTLKFISDKKHKQFKIDINFNWYFVINILFYISFEIYVINTYLVLQLIPSILLTYLIYSQISKVSLKITKNILKTISILTLLIPYYKILNEMLIFITPYLHTELYILPFIILTIILKLKVWSHKEIMIKVEWILLLIISAILVIDALSTSTIYDAIIIGILSLTSIISGMHFKLKSYFFVGVGMLLLTLYTQTKPFWGNMPWWVYLLVGGIALITFASVYEFQKQNKKNFFQEQKNKFKTKFKEWK